MAHAILRFLGPYNKNAHGPGWDSPFSRKRQPPPPPEKRERRRFLSAPAVFEWWQRITPATAASHPHCRGYPILRRTRDASCEHFCPNPCPRRLVGRGCVGPTAAAAPAAAA